MYLNKRKVILVISVSVLVFLFSYIDVKSQDIKITDGDTIRINGEKILNDLNISPNLRPENLSIIDFCKIAKKSFYNKH